MTSYVPPSGVALGEGAEFDLIRALLARWKGIARGIGDDAAVMDVPANERLVVSADTSVQDVHFRLEWLTPEEIGYRATMAALSDMAAMAARPLGMMLALIVPRQFTDAILRLADGIGEAARSAQCTIIGGDLSRGATLSIGVSVLGATARPVGRHGARPGDLVYVTGVLGGPAAALAAFSAGVEPERAARARFARPAARLREGMWAAQAGARAMIDISDGLVSDAGHLAAASGVRLTIDLELLPCMPGCAPESAATSGEEYELLFTGNAGIDHDAFERAFALPLRVIGSVSASPEGDVVFTRGAVRVDLAKGYDHFSS
ncbi:MAG: thiamine-phosphate kinase [Gemmatimonadaceae bacterium]